MGWYGYTPDTERVEFTAWIIDDGSNISGSTLEPNTFAASHLGELSAEISGTVVGQSILFEKRYALVPGTHDEPIIYSGVPFEAPDRITGRWAIDWEHGFHTGPFELSRLSGFATRSAKTAAIAAEKNAPQLPPRQD